MYKLSKKIVEQDSFSNKRLQKRHWIYLKLNQKSNKKVWETLKLSK